VDGFAALTITAEAAWVLRQPENVAKQEQARQEKGERRCCVAGAVKRGEGAGCFGRNWIFRVVGPGRAKVPPAAIRIPI
jgi:hypothetical protein